MMKARWMIPLVVVTLFSRSPLCPAQTQQIDGIAHIAFRVSDLDRSRDFFRRLGFEESFSLTMDGKTAEVFVKVNDRQFIELYPRTDETQSLGWMHVCYEAELLYELNALYVARGLNPSHAIKGGAGNLLFSLKDPEGRVVEFTQYLPGSRHFEDHGKHLGEHRISNELVGITIPVPDIVAARKFYAEGLGFEEQDEKSWIRMRISSRTHQWVELDTARARRRPEFWFAVHSADQAFQFARQHGLKVKRQQRIAFASDPDGNVFAFTQ